MATNNGTSSNEKTAAIIERARARLLEIAAAKKNAVATVTASLDAAKAAGGGSGSLLVPALSGWTIDRSREWNEQQTAAIHSFMAGKSFCLIGAAGTGKTSTLKGAVASATLNSLIPILETSTKHLSIGKPGIVLTSFTNMAVRQIAKHFSRDVTCVTIHKLLEFAPVYYEITKEDGTIGKTMRFEPMRNRANPLPRKLYKIVVDESSMVEVALIKMLEDALPDPSAVQWIYLGDLNQLPPVYGQAILGKKLMELPIIELTTVYRQALLSPIISLATKMKDGLAIPVSEKIVEDCGEHGKLTIHPWGKALHWEDALNKASDFCKAAIQQKELDPFKDIILCPFNVNLGCIELNSRIADWLGRTRNAVVYEVIAGFKTHYYAIGDKVLVNKREAVITNISRNRSYSGKRPINPDTHIIDRWGGAKKRVNHEGLSAAQIAELAATPESNEDIDALLASLSTTNTVVEDRKTSSSHQITVRFINGTDPTKWTPHDSVLDDELYELATLESASEVNDMLFAYAITVHKSQGSEWRKVFLILHTNGLGSHAQMCSRELIYTAITRAAQELYLICDPDRGMKAGTLTKAAKSPRLKGNTLAEKLVSLKEKFDKEEREAADSDSNTQTFNSYEGK
jgi:ATP-dependent exoDNAse (exonuclease V) alpha subunit